MSQLHHAEPPFVTFRKLKKNYKEEPRLYLWILMFLVGVVCILFLIHFLRKIINYWYGMHTQDTKSIFSNSLLQPSGLSK